MFSQKKKKSSSHDPLKNNKNYSYVCAFYFSLLEYLGDFMFSNFVSIYVIISNILSSK